jgi:hypothetical protein
MEPHHETETVPQAPINEAALTDCIEACFSCARACTTCADACLAEENRVELLRCIRLDVDCSDLCAATGRILTRRTELEPRMLQAALNACTAACSLCAQECRRHAELEHCRLCAEACRRCEEACLDLISHSVP